VDYTGETNPYMYRIVTDMLCTRVATYQQDRQAAALRAWRLTFEYRGLDAMLRNVPVPHEVFTRWTLGQQQLQPRWFEKGVTYDGNIAIQPGATIRPLVTLVGLQGTYERTLAAYTDWRGVLQGKGLEAARRVLRWFEVEPDLRKPNVRTVRAISREPAPFATPASLDWQITFDTEMMVFGLEVGSAYRTNDLLIETSLDIQGARTVYPATDPVLVGQSSQFFCDCNGTEPFRFPFDFPMSFSVQDTISGNMRFLAGTSDPIWPTISVYGYAGPPEQAITGYALWVAAQWGDAEAQRLLVSTNAGRVGG